MKYFFIVKPPAKKKFQKIFSQFKKTEKAVLFFTQKEGEYNAKNLAKKAKEEGFEKIVVVGGDGLINETINGLMEKNNNKFSNFSLAIIPQGTGNNIAKELGLPRNLKEAFDILKKNKTIEIDVGRVNERFFGNCFSLGFDAEINYLANKIKEKYQFLPKILSYFFAAIKEIIKRIPKFKVKIKGKEIKIQEIITLIAITNTQSYGAIFKINPGADFCDGKFNLCVINPVGKLKAIFALFLTMKGKHYGLKEVKKYLFSEEIRISTKEKVVWEVDGEVVNPEKDFLIKIYPKALRILVP